MERVIDSNWQNLKDNKIIAENCKVELKKSSIEFLGKGNVIYFLGGGENENNIKSDILVLENSKILCKGNNNLIFICFSKFPLKIVSTLGYGCTIYIGKNLWSTTPTYLMANEKSYIHIGNWGLLARNVWFRTSDMHMMYDVNTKKRINENRNIYIGEHVWLGQDVTCLKGTVVGHGSCIGLGSLCTGEKTKYVNSVYAGRPAEIMRKEVTWRHKGTNQVTEDELALQKYGKLTDEKFIYTNQQMEYSINFFNKNILMLNDIEEKILFLKNYKNSSKIFD